MSTYVRYCNKCTCIVHHATEISRNAAIRSGRLCRKCSKLGIARPDMIGSNNWNFGEKILLPENIVKVVISNTIQFKLKCPTCNFDRYYLRKYDAIDAHMNNSLCASCARSAGWALSLYDNASDKISKKLLGVSWIDRHGHKKATELKLNMSIRNSGINNPKVQSICNQLDITIDEYYNRKSKLWIYTNNVWKITNTQRINTLINYDKRGKCVIPGAYQLDHKYSIYAGFVNNIDPNIIGNIKNLQFIPWLDNTRKGHTCSITIENLITEISI